MIERYRCSCTICGWQGRRTLKAMYNPCPKCNVRKVYPDNYRVAGVAQAAEHLIRNQEREVSSTFASPRFEQVSRCIK